MSVTFNHEQQLYELTTCKFNFLYLKIIGIRRVKHMACGLELALQECYLSHKPLVITFNAR